MTWQDTVLTATTVIFSVSLIPQVYIGFKQKIGTIHPHTSVPTFIALYATAVTYLTLNLYFAAVGCFITGTMWLILFIQKLRYAHGPTS